MDEEALSQEQLVERLKKRERDGVRLKHDLVLREEVCRELEDKLKVAVQAAMMNYSYAQTMRDIYEERIAALEAKVFKGRAPAAAPEPSVSA